MATNRALLLLSLCCLPAMVALASASESDTPAKPADPVAPLRTDKSQLVAFDHSPFPYHGEIQRGRPFLDVVNGKRRGRTVPTGEVYWEQPTYTDRRSLLYLPKGFDARRPALIVVYFHGYWTQVARDVRDRHQVPRQLAESGLNAVLIAPQFAVNAPDSSPGRFMQPGAFARFLNEATTRLTQLHGDARVHASLAKAPVVLVAYSGGYQAAAFAAQVGGVNDRLRGIILLDAPYGEEGMLADWVSQRRADAFFVSAYATASRGRNAVLQQLLSERGVNFRPQLPDTFTPGTVAFFDVGDDVVHGDFVRRAWTHDPLKDLLERITGFGRTGDALTAR